MSEPTLVIGAGPAGLAAVACLLEAGREVAWVDNQSQPGGQIWRGGTQRSRAPALHALSARIEKHKATLQAYAGWSVLASEGPGHWVVGRDAKQHTLRPAHVLIATGARERFLPFPGWTLPGVTGAGGLQALVKGGWPVAGQRVVVAGSGPLLLATADTAREAGAQVLMVAEQAGPAALLRFASRLPAAKLAQAAALRWRLRATPYKAACWPVRALGAQRLEAVVMSDGRREWTVGCDALAVGFGLLPNVEIAQTLGCRIETGAVAVDDTLQTSLPGVWCAGEGNGIGGVDKSLLEGELAALHILGRADEAAALHARHQRVRAFGARLAQDFALRPEVLKLAQNDTLVCRCEDVSLAQLRPHATWRGAKLQTRCGMGACQGRVCGPIAQDLMGWPDAGADRGIRLPIQPTRISALINDGPIRP